MHAAVPPKSYQMLSSVADNRHTRCGLVLKSTLWPKLSVALKDVFASSALDSPPFEGSEVPQPTIVMASIAAIAALMRFQAVFCVCNCSTPVIMCAVSLFWLLGPVEGVRVKGYRRKNSPHPDLFDGPVVDGMNDIPP